MSEPDSHWTSEGELSQEAIEALAELLVDLGEQSEQTV
jgi:hypothetical protein